MCVHTLYGGRDISALMLVAVIKAWMTATKFLGYNQKLTSLFPPPLIFSSEWLSEVLKLKG